MFQKCSVELLYSNLNLVSRPQSWAHNQSRLHGMSTRNSHCDRSGKSAGKFGRADWCILFTLSVSKVNVVCQRWYLCQLPSWGPMYWKSWQHCWDGQWALDIRDAGHLLINADSVCCLSHYLPFSFSRVNTSSFYPGIYIAKRTNFTSGSF